MPILEVKNKNTKKNYREFLYFVTFFKNKFKIPILFLIAFLANHFLYIGKTNYGLEKYLITLLMLFIMAIFVVINKIETQIRTRFNTDIGEFFQVEEKIGFYDEYILIENEKLDSSAKIYYKDIYEVYNRNNLFINYFNSQQASLIAKENLTKEEVEIINNLYREKLGIRYKA